MNIKRFALGGFKHLSDDVLLVKGEHNGRGPGQQCLFPRP